MSKQLLFAAAGAAIGGAIGGPQGAKAGWAIGSALGAPDTNTQGPRLNDLSVMVSTYGKALPKVYGSYRYAGDVIWSADLIEVENEEDAGGKGGSQTVTNYSYFGSFAVSFGEGEVTGFKKIWANGVLIYNGSDSATVEELQASNNAASGITFYTGSETQTADPLIQADKGAANTQAYRGTAYIVFDRLALEKFGNRLPNIEAEVVSAGSSTGLRRISSTLTTGTFADRPIIFNADSVLRIGDAQDVNASQVNLASIDGDYIGKDGYSTLDNFPSINLYDYIRVGNFDISSSLTGTASVHILNYYSKVGQADKVAIGLYYDTELLSYQYESTLDFLLPTNLFITSAAISGDNKKILIIGNINVGQLNDPTNYYVISYNNGSPTLDDSGTLGSGSSLSGVIGRTATHSYLNVYGSMFFEDNYEYIWVCTGSGNNEISLSKIVDGNIELIDTLVNDEGVPPGAFTHPSIYVKDGICWIVTELDYIGVYTRNTQITEATATLSDIVSERCISAGLSPSDIDVTALTDDVYGYLKTGNSSARATIEPLQIAFKFDGYEDGSKIIFTKRGAAISVSVPEVNLGATTYGGNTELYSQDIQQNTELPSQIVVTYADKDRDYQIGSQRSQRINYDTENIIESSLPIAMAADFAKQTAEILHYNAWTEREKFSISLLNEYIDLNPTDVIDFTVGPETRICRITKINYGNVLSLDLVSDDSTIYTSAATAGASEDNSQLVSLIYSSKGVYLDIPMLLNSDNAEGIYLAACGYGAPWDGASIYRSLSQTGYSSVKAILDASTIGSTDTVLADGDTTTFDRTNTLTVSMVNGIPASVTEDEAVQGNNTYLIGSEIIRVVNVTDNGDETYTFDTLIRGRFGTEWATSSHAIGDIVVKLSANTLERIGAAIGTNYNYKAVTFGTSLSGAPLTALNNTGISLKPYSPIYIEGTRDGSLNLAITWMRRSRYRSSAFRTLPLYEDSESYSIEILDGVGGAVVNTYSSATESYSYTAAQQITDFGTEQSTVYVKIYQVSATVGNGYGTEATL